MILVDSSVWIDFFSSSPGKAGRELRRMIEESEPFALTGVVVSEILQGLTRTSPQSSSFLPSGTCWSQRVSRPIGQQLRSSEKRAARDSL